MVTVIIIATLLPLLLLLLLLLLQRRCHGNDSNRDVVYIHNALYGKSAKSIRLKWFFIFNFAIFQLLVDISTQKCAYRCRRFGVIFL
jgi:hypothetical protein